MSSRSSNSRGSSADSASSATATANNSSKSVMWTFTPKGEKSNKKPKKGEEDPSRTTSELPSTVTRNALNRHQVTDDDGNQTTSYYISASDDDGRSNYTVKIDEESLKGFLDPSNKMDSSNTGHKFLRQVALDLNLDGSKVQSEANSFISKDGDKVSWYWYSQYDANSTNPEDTKIFYDYTFKKNGKEITKSHLASSVAELEERGRFGGKESEILARFRGFNPDLFDHKSVVPSEDNRDKTISYRATPITDKSTGDFKYDIIYQDHTTDDRQRDWLTLNEIEEKARGGGQDSIYGKLLEDMKSKAKNKSSAASSKSDAQFSSNASDGTSSGDGNQSSH